MGNTNDLGKSPTQQKTDILSKYDGKGGSTPIKNNRRIIVDGIKGGKILRYLDRMADKLLGRHSTP